MQSSFVKHAAILAAATLFVRFIGFLYRVPLTNLIGDEGNGLYGVGYQFYLFMLVMSSAGLPSTISKMVSERLARNEYANAHAVFNIAMKMAIVFGLICGLFLWSMAGYFEVWFGYPGSSYSIQALAPTLLIVAIMAVYRGYFQGMNNTVPTAVSQVIEQIFHAIFSLVIAYIFIDQIELAAAGAAAGTGIGALLGLFTLMAIYKLASRKIKMRIRTERAKSRKRQESHRNIAREILFTAFPIIFGMAIYSMANSVDMAMIPHRMVASGAFSIEEGRAFFGQLSGKFVVLTTLPVAVSTALSVAVLPSIAGSNVSCDYQSVNDKIVKAMRISTFISIPAAVGLGVLAQPILLLLFPAHPEGAILLQVGAISVVFLSLNQIATGSLQGIGKIMIPVLGATIGVLSKIPLNYFLIAIPELNVVGAVISTCVCYFLAACVNFTALKRYTDVEIDVLGVFIKPAVAAILMGVTCFISYRVLYEITFGANAIATLFSIGFGGIVYFVIMILIGGIYKGDIERFPIIGKYV